MSNGDELILGELGKCGVSHDTVNRARPTPVRQLLLSVAPEGQPFSGSVAPRPRWRWRVGSGGVRATTDGTAYGGLRDHRARLAYSDSISVSGPACEAIAPCQPLGSAHNR